MPNLLFSDIDKLKKVQTFLNSKSRKSASTRRVYGFALAHFQTFLLNSAYKNWNLETILDQIIESKINVYGLLDEFVGWLVDRQKETGLMLSYKSIKLYVAGVKSYLEYYDVDIISRKFKQRVTLPAKISVTKEPIDSNDIRTILMACTNVRLKTFLLLLACTGMRSSEVLSLRNGDIDFNQEPATVHIRPENTKTKQGRDIYLTNEASNELKKFIDSRYGNKEEYKKHPKDMIFPNKNVKIDNTDVNNLYLKMNDNFNVLLDRIGMNSRYDGQGQQRRKITFHTFRTYVKSVVSMHTTADYSEWLLGHSYSTYWSIKPSERAELYNKCQPYLTYLDFPTVENVGKDFEAKIEEKDKQISDLQKRIKEIELGQLDLKKYKPELEYISEFLQKIQEGKAGND